MPKLTDTQTILLSTASQRDDRALYPLPGTLKEGLRTSKAIAALVKAGLAEERDQSLFATRSGLLAIGVEPEEGQGGGSAAPLPPASPQPRSVKSATDVDLLQREGGATLAELIAATGWLPHTIRAALTGLRKKGHGIERFKRDETTTYRIAG